MCLSNLNSIASHKFSKIQSLMNNLLEMFITSEIHRRIVKNVVTEVKIGGKTCKFVSL